MNYSQNPPSQCDDDTDERNMNKLFHLLCKARLKWHQNKGFTEFDIIQYSLAGENSWLLENCSHSYHLIPRRIHYITAECSSRANRTGTSDTKIMWQNIYLRYFEIKLQPVLVVGAERDGIPWRCWSQISLLEQTLRIWMATCSRRMMTDAGIPLCPSKLLSCDWSKFSQWQNRD